jgi:hypothetical protein
MNARRQSVFDNLAQLRSAVIPAHQHFGVLGISDERHDHVLLTLLQNPEQLQQSGSGPNVSGLDVAVECRIRNRQHTR